MKRKFLQKTARKRSLSGQIFTAQIILMLVSLLVVGLVSYTVSANALIRQQQTNNIQLLNKMVLTMDTSLQEFEKSLIIESTRQTYGLITGNPLSGGYSIINDLIDHLRTLKNGNRSIESIYVYLPLYNMLVTSDDGRWNINSFYDLDWRTEISPDKTSQWLAARTIVNNADETVSLISLAFPLPYGQTLHPDKPIFLVNFRESRLYQLIANVNEPQGTLNMVIDPTGHIVMHTEKEMAGKIPEMDLAILEQIIQRKTGSVSLGTGIQRKIYSHATSAYNQWRYVRVVPEKEIIGPARQIRWLILLTAFVWLVIGIGYAAFRSKRLMKPLTDMVGNLRRNAPDGVNPPDYVTDDLDFLQTTIDKIVENNQHMTIRHERNQDDLRTSLIRELLASTPENENLLAKKLQLYDINLPEEKHCVLLVVLDRQAAFVKDYAEEERKMWMFALRNVLEEMATKGGKGLLVSAASGQFVLVMRGCEEIEASRIADEIRATVASVLPFTVSVIVGDPISRLADIGPSFGQVQELSRYRRTMGLNRVISRKSVEPACAMRQPILHFNDEALMNAMREGQPKEFIRQMEMLNALIRENPCVEPESVLHVFYGILGNMVGAVIEQGWTVQDIFGPQKDLYKELSDLDNVEDMSSWLAAVFHQLSTYVREGKNSRKQSVMDTVIALMESNYGDNLSLSEIAKRVYLSPAYLSRQFKEVIGKNFMEYLTEIRMKKAKELLKNSSLKVSDVAEQVSYKNVGNFIRIFKKIVGVTPGQLRERYIEGERKEQ